jgi:hypothetical protein
MENDPDDPTPPRLALYDGVVTARNDPLKIGRVKLRIPGIVDESDWAFPLSMGRGRGRGFFDVPDVGAEVGVWWMKGDSLQRPYYVPSNWVAPGGHGQGPSTIQAEDVSPDDAPDIKVWETEDHLILLDGRAGRQALEVRDKVTGDGVAYDRTTMTIEVKGTVGVKLSSEGAVDIQGLAVTIMGRPVVPGAGPIR